MRKLIKQLYYWNAWRKKCTNHPVYKLMVLLGLVKSPTFTIFKAIEEYSDV